MSRSPPGDYLSKLRYINHVLEILGESPAVKKSASGILKQTGYAAGGAAIGGIFGGPAGALMGTVIGGILGYSAVDPYDVRRIVIQPFVHSFVYLSTRLFV
ncbi:unnamed protein product [Anisakis simplex]|uniref:Gly-zipper_Omp domain-containing protein n=1 Tax=Anisakis simplex TaxID=6269 RepID=A0A0M3KA65_ANISI|nr:unnamed protein product [Anisakis simplex]